MAEQDLDSLVSERVMGRNLHNRARAIIEVGRDYVTVTGPVFELRTGDQLPMPAGETLPKPESSCHWNDRYYHRVGEFLMGKYPEIAAEVEEWRMKPKPYSTDITAAWEVAEHLRAEWLQLDAHETCFWQFIDCASSGWRVDICWGHHDGDQELHSVSDASLPRAICKAALLWAEEEE